MKKEKKEFMPLEGLDMNDPLVIAQLNRLKEATEGALHEELMKKTQVTEEHLSRRVGPKHGWGWDVTSRIIESGKE